MFENGSCGCIDFDYSKKIDKCILIIGFDLFFLDRNIN